MNRSKYYNEEKALKEFLLDIECLNPLTEWTSKFNLFEILKITRTEIKHSNILSWILNPNENHGFSDSIIKGFVQYIITTYENKFNVFNLLLMEFHDFIILREWKYIDIFAVSHKNKFVICIENKIGSNERDNQLDSYRRVVNETYPDYKKMFIFLSLDGCEPSDTKNWYSMGYQNVLDIIENSRNRIKLIPEAELLIDNYVETIRRVIVGDERLAKICADIYAKHQKALDLIYENKPDRASDTAEIFKQWATEMTEKNEIEVILDKCTKRYTRFKTKAISELLPDAEKSESAWKTKNHYFYEIINNSNGDEFFIQLSISAKNMSDELVKKCKKIIDCCNSKPGKTNWGYYIPFTTKKIKIDEEFTESNIYDQLNYMLKEVKDFEGKLKDRLYQNDK